MSSQRAYVEEEDDNPAGTGLYDNLKKMPIRNEVTEVESAVGAMSKLMLYVFDNESYYQDEKNSDTCWSDEPDLKQQIESLLKMNAKQQGSLDKWQSHTPPTSNH